MTPEEDAEEFLDAADSLAGLPKRELQKRAFRLKNELGAGYEFSVEGFEEDYEALLKTEEGDYEVRLVVDHRRDSTEVSAFVLRDGEAVVNEVREL